MIFKCAYVNVQDMFYFISFYVLFYEVYLCVIFAAMRVTAQQNLVFFCYDSSQVHYIHLYVNTFEKGMNLSPRTPMD